MACTQEEEELSEPCGSEMGDMMTPPQPAPRSPPAQEGSEAEMSFRDLVDDSDEEEREGRGMGKSAMHGQVLVDPEDLQVCMHMNNTVGYAYASPAPSALMHARKLLIMIALVGHLAAGPQDSNTIMPHNATSA